MRKTTFLMKCALTLLIACFFSISSSNAQGTYCGNAFVSNLDSNWRSLCSQGFSPRHYVYVPSADGEIEVCGSNLNVYRACVNGSAQSIDNGTVTGSCTISGVRSTVKRYSVTANNPIYFRVYRTSSSGCVGVRVISTSASGISQLCDEGTVVECGQTVNGDNFSGGNDFETSDYTCFGGNDDFSGNDVVYKVEVPANENEVIFRMQPLQKDLDMFIYRCFSGSPICITRSLNSGLNQESIRITNAQSKTYYVVVDGYDTDQQGTFTLEVSGCGSPQLPDFTCEGGIPIECGDVVNSNNFETGNNFQEDSYANCYGGSATFEGNDELYTLDLTRPTDVTIGISNMTADLDLFILQCNDSGTPTCIAASLNGPGSDDQVSLSGVSGKLFIVVESQFTTSLSNFTLTVESDDCDDCPEDNLSCDDMAVVYGGGQSGSLRYGFQMPSSYGAGTWTVTGGAFGSRTVAIGSSRTAFYTFPAAGTYTICYTYKVDGCDVKCCRTMQILNPYDCRDITYSYDDESNRYLLTIPGIEAATWSDDDANTILGTGTTVRVPVSGTCRVRNFSALFFDPAVNAYRMCCISVYICNPYDCDDIQNTYDPIDGTWSLSAAGLSSSDVLFWQNDDTNTQIAGSTNFVDVPQPSAGTCGNYSLFFYDQALRSFRICCTQICVNEDGCTGTPSDVNCGGSGVVEDEPVCGCDGNTYENSCEALAAGVFQWEDGACEGEIDADCDALTFDFVGSLRYEFSVGGLNNGVGSWTITGNAFPEPRTIGVGGSVAYTFPQTGTYEVCFVYAESGGVVEGPIKQCCKTIEVVENQFDCNDITYDYDSATDSYILTLPGVPDAAWQDDDNNISLGFGESVSVPLNGACGIRNFTALFFDTNTNSYRQCCISLYFCDPFDCDNIQKVYDPVTSTWTLSAANLSSSDVIFWRNDDTGVSIANRINFVDVPNPSAGTCNNYSLFYFDESSQTYRVCCLQLCVNADGCTGTPSDVTCGGSGVVEEQPVCGCDGITYESECDALAAGVQVWTAGPCIDPIDPDCDELTYDYISSLRYEFTVGGLNSGVGAWTISGPGFPQPRTIGTGGTTTYTFPQAGVYEVCFVYAESGGVVEGPLRQCCKTIEVVSNLFDCDEITYDYDEASDSYTLTLAGVTDATWQDDDNERSLGIGESVSIPVNGACGIRNFSVLFYDTNLGAYRQCCISLYVCNPTLCDTVDKIYDPVTGTWTLSAAGVSSSDVLFWRNDKTGTTVANGINFVEVPNPAADSCSDYSLFYFDAATQTYRVCSLELCLDADGCVGTPSDVTCGGSGVVEEQPVCGCDSNTYESACDALAAGVQVWTAGPCVDPINPDCDDLTFEFVSPLRYRFTVNGLNSGVGAYTISGPGFPQPRTIGTGNAVEYTFPSAGTYTICFVYTASGGVVEGPVQQCCKTIEVVNDPFDCDLISYTYDSNTNSYNLTIPGVTDATWLDDDNNVGIGSGTTVNVAVDDNNCGVRSFSVYFFDPAIDGYRVCCIRLYICDPFDCNDITYGYDTPSDSYVLSIPDYLTDPQWFDDDNNVNLGTTNTVSVALNGACGVRNFSVYFFDPAIDGYRVCCIRLYFCDPNNCDAIEQTFDDANNMLDLTIPGITATDVLFWTDGDGQQIAGSASKISVDNPAIGDCITVCAYFYDESFDGYRQCCIELCNDQPLCAGVTDETFDCKDDSTYDYSFTLENFTAYTVDAEFIMLTPGMAFDGCSLIQKVEGIGASQAITLNLDDCILALSAGMQISYKIVLREAGKTEGWCCHLDPITITLPACTVPCESTPQPDLVCTEEYEPVCGCNDVTYSNACYAQRAGITAWEAGPCEADVCENIENLVKNGAFEGGNWAFTSDYAFQCTCGDDTYCVNENANNKCGDWSSTTGDGKFLIIEGEAGGANKRVWRQNVAVSAGLDYTFYVDFYPDFTAGSQPVLQMFINGTAVGSSFQGVSGAWTTYGVEWNAPSTTFVNLEIRKIGSTGGTNDFGIDNLRFEFCLDDVNVTPEFEDFLEKNSSNEVSMMAAPNPFTDVTTISFTLDDSMPAKVSVFNMNGQEVFTQERLFDAGINNVEFRADASLSAGVYYYRLETATQTLTKSMVLTRR